MQHHPSSTATPPPTVPDTAPPIVFFDGECGLCNSFVDFLLDRDRRGVLHFAPLQGETARQFLPEAMTSDLNTAAFAADGRVWTESSAIVRIFWRLGLLWRIIGTLLWLVPLPFRNAGYRWVAGSRYRLFGKHETCRMPSEAERGRLLP